MVFLILESLGSTELIFILIMALVFLGPRKLPQISRTLGKNLAEFRKASEEFKRTWDKEATLDDTDDTPSRPNQIALAEQNAIVETAVASGAEAPTVATSEQAIARDTSSPDELQPSLVSDGDVENVAHETSEAKPAPKSEWV